MQYMIERTHIGIFGPRNAGKSSLINRLTGQQVSIVSPEAGTTTDPVSKPIEINGLGACVFIDTAGYDDTGRIGEMRVTKTKETLSRCDIAIFLLPDTLTAGQIAEAKRWYQLISERCEQTIVVLNRFNGGANTASGDILPPPLTPEVEVDVVGNKGIDELLARLGFIRSRVSNDTTIVTHLVKSGDTVLLVMPQDIQAPAGRLILPQVQTIRELLDYGCATMCVTTAELPGALKALAAPPALIVTDSQAFKAVYDLKPAGVPLTSFSVLMARYKGDIEQFVDGTKAFARLTPASRILIAEACTHAPLAEDIGREKIPALIHRTIDTNIRIDIVSGYDWPDDVEKYDLVIHCGACMFNRTQVLSRLKILKEKRVPVTNYGIAIAYFTKILDKIVY